ncbi:MAG: maltokinase [Thermoproteota archaeon]|nr:maltokinase [Thermoproteota archaeon]
MNITQRLLLNTSIATVLNKPNLIIPLLLPWIAERRWSSLKGVLNLRVKVLDFVVLERGVDYSIIVTLTRISGLRGRNRISEKIFLPLFLSVSQDQPGKGFRIECLNGNVWVVEAEHTKEYNRRLLEGFNKGERIKTSAQGIIKLEYREDISLRPDLFRIETLGKGDTTNIVVKIKDTTSVIIKTYKIVSNVNPEPEFLEVLANAEFKYAPRLLGRMTYQKKKKTTITSILESYEENVGDGRKPFLDNLVSDLSELRNKSVDSKGLSELVSQKPGSSKVHELSVFLGTIIAEFHNVLASSHRRSFQSKRVLKEDIERWSRRATLDFEECMDELSTILNSNDLPFSTRRVLSLLIKEIEVRRKSIEEQIGLFRIMLDTIKTRTHQDLHLAQLLFKKTPDSCGFQIIDFEGDPQRTGKKRLELEPPLRDLGVLVRSFGYIRYMALAQVLKEYSYSDAIALASYFSVEVEDAIDFSNFKSINKSSLNNLVAYSRVWEVDVSNAVLDGYFRRSKELNSSSHFGEEGLDESSLRLIVKLWAIEKALLEIKYELHNRPQNILIPVEGLLSYVPVTRLSLESEG